MCLDTGGWCSDTFRVYDMDDFVDQLRELLDHLAVNRAAIAGFSLGGLIVRAFALAHPDRAQAIAMANPCTSPQDIPATFRTQVSPTATRQASSLRNTSSYRASPMAPSPI